MSRPRVSGRSDLIRLALVDDDKLIDIAALAVRLRYVAGGLAVLALVGAVVDGLRNGLTFSLLARWIALLAFFLVIAAALLVAIQALRGAGHAARRGQRLAGRDVGLIPPKRSTRRHDGGVRDEG